MEKFSAFAADEDKRLEGDKTNIGDLFNHEICITAYRLMPSKAVKGKSCLQLQYTLPDEDESTLYFPIPKSSSDRSSSTKTTSRFLRRFAKTEAIIRCHKEASWKVIRSI